MGHGSPTGEMVEIQSVRWEKLPGVEPIFVPLSLAPHGRTQGAGKLQSQRAVTIGASYPNDFRPDLNSSELEPQPLGALGISRKPAPRPIARFTATRRHQPRCLEQWQIQGVFAADRGCATSGCQEDGPFTAPARLVLIKAAPLSRGNSSTAPLGPSTLLTQLPIAQRLRSGAQ